MNAELLITLLVAVVSSTGVAGLVAGMFGRRKISAEATEIISRTAGEQVQRVTEELHEVRQQLRRERDARDELSRKVDRLERREMQMRDLLMVHGGWDHRMQTELEMRMSPDEVERLGLYPAPPLYPPT